MFVWRNSAQPASLQSRGNKWECGRQREEEAMRRWGESQLWWQCCRTFVPYLTGMPPPPSIHPLSVSFYLSLAWPVCILNQHRLIWTHWAHLSAWVYIGSGWTLANSTWADLRIFLCVHVVFLSLSTHGCLRFTPFLWDQNNIHRSLCDRFTSCVNGKINDRQQHIWGCRETLFSSRKKTEEWWHEERGRKKKKRRGDRVTWNSQMILIKTSGLKVTTGGSHWQQKALFTQWRVTSTTYDSPVWGLTCPTFTTLDSGMAYLFNLHLNTSQRQKQWKKNSVSCWPQHTQTVNNCENWEYQHGLPVLWKT